MIQIKQDKIINNLNLGKNSYVNMIQNSKKTLEVKIESHFSRASLPWNWGHRRAELTLNYFYHSEEKLPDASGEICRIIASLIHDVSFCVRVR